MPKLEIVPDDLSLDIGEQYHDILSTTMHMVIRYGTIGPADRRCLRRVSRHLAHPNHELATLDLQRFEDIVFEISPKIYQAYGEAMMNLFVISDAVDFLYAPIETESDDFPIAL
jgi:hypothetical protein